MYKKILIPLDGSPEGEQVVRQVLPELDPAGEIVLLLVITLSKSRGGVAGGTPEQMAMGYLRMVAERNVPNKHQVRPEVTSAVTAALGIVRFAGTESAGLIAMFTHGRTGLWRMIKGSVTREVQRLSKGKEIEVRGYRKRDLST